MERIVVIGHEKYEMKDGGHETAKVASDMPSLIVS